MTTFNQRAETALRLILEDLHDMRVPDHNPDQDERIDKALCEHCDPHSCDRLHCQRERELRGVKHIVNTAVDALRAHLARYARDEYGINLTAEVTR